MADWYVATDGTAGGDGSIGDPWDIDTAFAHPGSVDPGDTIYLRGGTYQTGDINSVLTGTESQRITVRSYTGEWAKIDIWDGTEGPGNFFLNCDLGGAYTDYRDLEIFNANTHTRFTTDPDHETGLDDIGRGKLDITGDYLRVINCYVHDLNGVSWFSNAEGGEVYGCIIYNNGWDTPTSNQWDHAMYTQNNNVAVKLYTDNIMFNQFGHGVHAYGGASGPMDKMTFVGNIMFANGHAPGSGSMTAKPDFLIGGTQPVNDLILNQNFSYSPVTNSVSIGYDFGGNNNDISASSNYFYSGTCKWPKTWSDITGTGNQCDGLSGVGAPVSGWTEVASPTGNKVEVRPNSYEAGRGHIVIYNWDDADTVDANISSVISVGEEYAIYHVYDLDTAVLSGTYGGGTVAVPMAITAPPTILGDISDLGTPINLTKEFGAFLLLKTADAESPVVPVHTVYNQSPVVPVHTVYNRCGRGESWQYTGPAKVGW